MARYTVTRTRIAPPQVIDMDLEINGPDTPEARAQVLEAAHDYVSHPETTDFPEVTLHDMSEPYFVGEGQDDDWVIAPNAVRTS